MRCSEREILRNKEVSIIIYKENNNGKPIRSKVTHSGICKFYEKRADVTSFFIASLGGKTDLQRTYNYKGYKCSLQVEGCFPNPACIHECHLIQKIYL